MPSSSRDRRRPVFAQAGIALVGLGVVIASQGCSNAAEESSADHDAIVGGKAAPDSEFAAVGSIAMEQFDGTFKHACTGTLIAPNLVLSAQHCVRLDFDTDETWMRSNPMTFNIGSKLAQAKKRVALKSAMVSVVDAQGISRWGSDVAVYALEEPITDVKPLAMAKGSIPEDVVGEDLTAVGYGYTDLANQKTGERRQAQLRVKAVSGQPYAVEYGTHDEFVAIHAAQWSAQDLAALMPQIEARYASRLLPGYEAYAAPRSPKGPCTQKGDSGGPLLRKEGGQWVVYGVVSAELPITLREEKSCRGTIYATLGPAAQHVVDVMKNDPCADESTNGRCDGDTLVRCSIPNDPERRVVREACESGCTNDRLDAVCRD